MTIDPEELVNLDVTIATFVIPRLEAFRDAAESYPDDLGTIEEWRAELDRMAAAFHRIRTWNEPDQAGLDLFAKRLGHLWQ
jgi:hypothetical protein